MADEGGPPQLRLQDFLFGVGPHGSPHHAAGQEHIGIHQEPGDQQRSDCQSRDGERTARTSRITRSSAASSKASSTPEGLRSRDRPSERAPCDPPEIRGLRSRILGKDAGGPSMPGAGQDALRSKRVAKLGSIGEDCRASWPVGGFLRLRPAGAGLNSSRRCLRCRRDRRRWRRQPPSRRGRGRPGRSGPIGCSA